MSLPVPLHRCRVSWANDAYVDIEHTRGVGGQHFEPVLLDAATLTSQEEADERIRADGLTPPMCIRENGTLFRPFQLREETNYFIDICVPIGKQQALERAGASKQWPLAGRVGRAFQREPERRWKDGPNGNSCIVTGSINLRSYAGLLTLGIDGTDMAIEAEVVCRKLNYFQEFQHLLTQIAEELAELLLQQEAPASIEFTLSDTPSVLDTGALVVLRHLMNPANLPAAVSAILARPHSRVVTRTAIEEHPDVSAIAIDSIDEAVSDGQFIRGGAFGRLFRGYTPRLLPSEISEESSDTVENRYVLNFLTETRHLANRLLKHLRNGKNAAVANECEQWVTKLDELNAADLWRTVSPLTAIPSNSQVLQRRDGYREILHFDLQLKMGLSLDWDQSGIVSEGLRGDIRPVSELYEYWCFLMLRRLVRELCGGHVEAGGNLLTTSKSGFTVNLRKGQKSKTRFKFTSSNGEQVAITLFYNRKFVRPESDKAGWDGSYTASFHPDFSLLVRREKGAIAHWLHFDSKYRVHAETLLASFTSDTEGEEDDEDLGSDSDDDSYATEIKRTHLRDDLFKMHTYRDGILGSRGAYVLFPGDAHSPGEDAAQHRVNIRHPSGFGVPLVDVPSVGAFPLTPGISPHQLASLGTFLAGVFESLASTASYAEEDGLLPPI